MRRTTLDVAIDGNTMMLIRLAQALKLSEAVPVESGRTLERMAKAVRLFLQARENGAAADLLDQMLAMLPEDDADLADVRAAVRRGVDRVHRSVGFVGVRQARQDVAMKAAPTGNKAA